MIVKRLLALSLIWFLAACSTVPVTGRRQLKLVPSSELQSMSYTSYRQVLGESKVVSGTAEANMVKAVGGNIQRAVEQFMAKEGQSDKLEGYAWEFNLIEENTVNAWCMPGGKVAVYTGILPVTQNEDGLAVVMGHEIAHAIANHGGERMSQQLATQLGGVGLAVAMRDKPAQTQGLFMAAFGLGSQVGVLLPFSRLQESEADRLGLIFMAMAGYNPAEAVPFWQRMAAQGGGRQPEFLSTHPAPETRIRDLQKHQAEAMKYYKPR